MAELLRGGGVLLQGSSDAQLHLNYDPPPNPTPTPTLTPTLPLTATKAEGIKEGMMGLDCGPESTRR